MCQLEVRLLYLCLVRLVAAAESVPAGLSPSPATVQKLPSCFAPTHIEEAEQSKGASTGESVFDKD